MLKACRKAEKVNTKDPYATYEVARELAEAYDNVLIHMELDQQKGLTQDFSGESILSLNLTRIPPLQIRISELSGGSVQKRGKL